MGRLDVRTLARESDLDASRTPWDELGQATLADTQEGLVDLCGICLALNDIEDGDVAAALGHDCRNHLVLWLQETTHDIQDSSLADTLGFIGLVAGEWCVAGHQVVTARRRNERCDETDKVIVHVSRVAQSGGTGTHDRRHQLVGLCEGGVLDMQHISSNAIQRGIVENNNRIRVVGKTLETQHGVVWLDNNVTSLCIVGEYRIRLNELLRISVIQTFQ